MSVSEAPEADDNQDGDDAEEHAVVDALLKKYITF
jgi:hypothetical protein